MYGSSKYIYRKGPKELKELGEAGLSRIHVGLETRDDHILQAIKKGTTASEQIQAGLWVKEAGIELSEYIILGIGGKDRSEAHTLKIAGVLNAIAPDFVRLRTFVPKINTLLLHQIRKGRSQVLSPHEVLSEIRLLLNNLNCPTSLYSVHYTNYLNLEGRMPEAKDRFLSLIDKALAWEESCFRPLFIGTQ